MFNTIQTSIWSMKHVEQHWYTKFHFLWLAEMKCAYSYVNWGAEHESHNKNASLAMVFELSSLTCTTT
jgi:hypothetical protein